MNDDFNSNVDMGANDGVNIDGDWNTDDEYAPPPLCGEGYYLGGVTEVKYDPTSYSIVWNVTLSGNEGKTMSDGSTPVDGQVFTNRNWLPKPGDESIYTKTGRMTKRQAKINMLKEFADDMKLDMSTPQKVKDAIMNGSWVGISVQCQITLDTYKGRTRNVISKMVALEGSTDNGDMPF